MMCSWSTRYTMIAGQAAGEMGVMEPVWEENPKVVFNNYKSELKEKLDELKLNFEYIKTNVLWSSSSTSSSTRKNFESVTQRTEYEISMWNPPQAVLCNCKNCDYNECPNRQQAIECNHLCKADKCKNKELTATRYPLEVDFVDGSFCVRALEHIPANEPICEWRGRMLPFAIGEALHGPDSKTKRLTEKVSIIQDNVGNESFFIRSVWWYTEGFNFNCRIRRVVVNDQYKLVVMSSRDLKAGEEILFDHNADVSSGNNKEVQQFVMRSGVRAHTSEKTRKAKSNQKKLNSCKKMPVVTPEPELNEGRPAVLLDIPLGEEVEAEQTVQNFNEIQAEDESKNKEVVESINENEQLEQQVSQPTSANIGDEKDEVHAGQKSKPGGGTVRKSKRRKPQKLISTTCKDSKLASGQRGETGITTRSKRRLPTEEEPRKAVKKARRQPTECARTLETQLPVPVSKDDKRKRKRPENVKNSSEERESATVNCAVMMKLSEKYPKVLANKVDVDLIVQKCVRASGQMAVQLMKLIYGFVGRPIKVEDVKGIMGDPEHRHKKKAIADFVLKTTNMKIKERCRLMDAMRSHLSERLRIEKDTKYRREEDHICPHCTRKAFKNHRHFKQHVRICEENSSKKIN